MRDCLSRSGERACEKRRVRNRLHGILLTHEHTDHCCGAGGWRGDGRPLSPMRPLSGVQARDALPFLARELPTGGTIAIGSIGIRSFPVSHDAAETVGYVLEAGGSLSPILRTPDA